MLKQAKIKLKSLIYDDSGVAMAYTIMVFLFFFMLCVSTYAMSENIRQRMELQNACDAAVYSGAVVQADMLSRLAVLNRALAWTYIETNKRHMDYTVDEWLQRIVPAYQSIADSAQTYNWGGNCGRGSNGAFCACPLGQVGICWFAGSNSLPARVNLNGSQDVLVSRIRNAMGRAYPTEETAINNGYANIGILNREINAIRLNINRFIGIAVSNTLNSQLANGDSFDYHTDGAWQNTNPATFIIPQTSEAQFVNYANTDIDTELDRGYNVWWNPDTSADRRFCWSGNGFARNYTTGLIARGEARARQHWHSHGIAQSHSCGIQKNWDFTTLGRRLLPTTAADPAALSSSFFGAPGTILVTAKRRLNNPFVTIFGANNSEGLYGAFNGAGRDMWVVSTARAGIRLGDGYSRGEPAGNYHILYPGDTSGLPKYASGMGIWNLCEEDWDAVMIPVDRAWHDASSGSWRGAPSAENILSAVQVQLRPHTPYQGAINRNIRH